MVALGLSMSVSSGSVTSGIKFDSAQSMALKKFVLCRKELNYGDKCCIGHLMKMIQPTGSYICCVNHFFSCALRWKPSGAAIHVWWLRLTHTHTRSLRQIVGKIKSVFMLGYWNLVCRFSKHYLRDCSNRFYLNMSTWD